MVLGFVVVQAGCGPELNFKKATVDKQALDVRHGGYGWGSSYSASLSLYGGQNKRCRYPNTREHIKIRRGKNQKNSVALQWRNSRAATVPARAKLKFSNFWTPRFVMFVKFSTDAFS